MSETACTCGASWPCTGPGWMGDHSPACITSEDGVPLLDQLEEAREAALTIRSAYPSLPVLQQKGANVEAVWSDGADMTWVECEEEAYAALIVAAVNALPELIRLAREREALRRAMEALLDPEAGMAWPLHGDRVFRERDIRAAIAGGTA